MKKILFVLIATLLVACEGPAGPMGNQGAPGAPGSNGVNGAPGSNGVNGQDGVGNKWYTTSVTVKKSDWKLAGEQGSQAGDLNTFYFADINIPQLTQEVYNKGSVLAYITTENGVKNGLPFVLHKGDVDDQGEFLWTQTYDFQFSVGKIGFNATYSDFSTTIIPDAETFYLVLIW